MVASRPRFRLLFGRERPPVPPVQRETSRPRELAAGLVKQLEFKVLRRLDGYLFGDYTGLFYGPSLDLAEVREYQPGDEVRRIDWNVTARTGTVHVRQYREEHDVAAWLIVDLSPSMDFGTRRVLKRSEAVEFAGLVATVMSRRGNRVGALAFSPRGATTSPLSAGRAQALTIVRGLLEHSSADSHLGGVKSPSVTDLAGALEHTVPTLRRRGLVFVVSDFLSSEAPKDHQPAWGTPLRRLAYSHDVIAVRVSDPAEHVLPRAGDLRLRDPETGEEVWIDTLDKRVRREHARLVELREKRFAKTLRSAQVDLLELSTAHDIVDPILKFTLRRRGRRL